MYGQPYVPFTALDAGSDDVARLLAAAPQDEAREDDYSFLNDPLPEPTPTPLRSLVVDIAVPDEHPDAPRHTDHLNKLWRRKWEYSHDGHVKYRCDEKEYFSRTQAGKRAFDMYFWLQEAQCILRTLQDSADEHSEVPFFPLFSVHEDLPRPSVLAALNKLAGEDIPGIEYYDLVSGTWKGCSLRHRFMVKSNGFLFLRRAGVTTCKDFDDILDERLNTLPGNANTNLPRQRELRRQDAKQAKRTVSPAWPSSLSSSSSGSMFSVPDNAPGKRRKLDTLSPSSQISSSSSQLSSSSDSGSLTSTPSLPRSPSPVCIHKLLADIAVQNGYSKRTDFGTVSPTLVLSDDDTPALSMQAVERAMPRRLPEPQSMISGGGRSTKPWPNGWPAVDIIDGFEQMKDL
ncbi:hypothetical protein CONPUDRAFT_159092 [Coniophora puteana RWD-64-598 SS2]|uniref:Uncharacterized protein n=1 Tax=Coniophora puteana (strain RWD-64-598) TaxID=741705 RepID=A0A5M3M8W5_CONPW|nr:uncharacterized protein CONPUDRAFT_159092 [Coniophora puteana RWD-64-598 SS2]EIW75648.1 hypothetical protein CONPUDRAFT_159092 [Coniophora puteana RWD-64-598 SS2]